MTFWYAPSTFKEYIQRFISMRTALLLTAITILVFTEFRFDWMENAVGTYLVSTNKARPESGAIWDQGHQSESARQTLNEVMSQRQDVQREVRRSTSMGQVLAGLKNNGGAMISATHFIELYLKLPPVISQEIVSPFTLLSRLSSTKWQRAFFEYQNNQLSIYLLDDHNQVLHRLAIGPDLIAHIKQGEVAIHTSLNQLSDFNNQIYSAKRFFALLNTLPDQVKRGIIASPEELLRTSGRIARIGISQESVDEMVSLGFEVEDMQGAKVILTQGRYYDVQQLLWLLQTEAAGGGQGTMEGQP